MADLENRCCDLSTGRRRCRGEYLLCWFDDPGSGTACPFTIDIHLGGDRFGSAICLDRGEMAQRVGWKGREGIVRGNSVVIGRVSI